MSTTDPDKQPFTAHLEELRSRLIKSFIAVGVGFLLSYAFKQQIFDILTLPLVGVLKPGDHLIYTNLPEAFFTFLKAAFICGLMLASPVILYQFWMFVAPGLYDKERRLVLPILFLSTFFFVGGALFGYFIVFPIGFEFFLSFASDTIRPMPSMKEYLGFSSKLLLAFGLAFELPLVITFMARLGIVSVPTLKKYRKYAIFLFFVAAAILTPPDVVTQVFMALPMMLLYEISILGARFFGRKTGKEKEGADDADASASSDPQG
ncbi:twin-arginine translocase subunit TatC [Desulfatitalea alkaliphila]|uniref:Sec-independent protein translocase protein TatC n=1 Tax=Desulfatitalea alkaliphila TaxID=2929485 RepID=A0AA41URG2_9BACT|nr:twin-arginine translocase subunit TatC [Desulfatitalea alkaliphila]MCJ8502333.1 twin-arginine translocase subunit TatC [Desulfatitalea alkaliphila]